MVGAAPFQQMLLPGCCCGGHCSSLQCELLLSSQELRLNHSASTGLEKAMWLAVAQLAHQATDASPQHTSTANSLHNSTQLANSYNSKNTSSPSSHPCSTATPHTLSVCTLHGHTPQVPQRLLMGPGPANAYPRILAAQALPLLGHMHPPFLKIMDEISEGLRYAFQTDSKYTLMVSGTGHAGVVV